MHVIDVLRGKKSDKAAQWGHDQLSVFGIGADLDDAEWRAVIRQLVAAGMLHADLAEHGALKLTEEARPVLKGEQTLELRRHVVRKAAAKAKKARTATLVADLSAEDTALFEALRQWRADTAREQGVPAYVILHDRTLRELAEMRPSTRGHLAMVSGIGAAKIEHYGAELLSIIEADAGKP
jgi:ATP-dependent DNA helicase RecQ